MTKQIQQTRDRVDALVKEVKSLSAIILEMRKEQGSQGVVLSNHQAYFELLQTIIKKQQEEKKIDLVKN